MDRRRNKNKNHNWNSEKKNNYRNNFRNENYKNSHNGQNSQPKFQYVAKENPEATQKHYKAIQEFKEREVVCAVCGKPIFDMSSAIADKSTGNPVHFDCVMEKLSESEKVGQNEKICYIGQGRFGILYYENPRDVRHFTIKKIIDWEEKDKRSEWRNEMSGLFSQVE